MTFLLYFFKIKTADVNVSLTAMGILWTTVDFVSSNSNNSSSNNSKSLSSYGGDVDNGDIEDGHDGKKVSPLLTAGQQDDDDDDEEGNANTNNANNSKKQQLTGVWDAMLDELGSLALDSRVEVRNCAVNTLVSAVAANGATLSLHRWERCLAGVLLPLVAKVAEKAAAATKVVGVGGASQQEVRPGVRLAMHHSRDTAHKQWSETRVLTLQGLSRLLRTAITSTATSLSSSISTLNHAPENSGGSGALASSVFFGSQPLSARLSAAATTAIAAATAAHSSSLGFEKEEEDEEAKWFGSAWLSTLDLAVEAVRCGSDEQEVALAGIQLLVSLTKLSSVTGLSNEPVRYAAGMRVVDGALVQVKTTNSNSKSSASASASTAAAAESNKEELHRWGSNSSLVWDSAWGALNRACLGLELDDEGEVAAKLIEGLKSVLANG
jgi:hypothetical protein